MIKEPTSTASDAMPCSAWLVVHRSGPHWDIYDQHRRRRFCIRGEEGRITVYNETRHADDLKGAFRTVDAAMAYICAEMMNPQNTSMEAREK